MSAWYVLTACGIHPVCPGETRFEITTPLFDHIVIQVGKGKTFTIQVRNNSPENVYIQSARLNGKTYTKCHIDYQEIIAGGALEIEVGAAPNQEWGIN